MAKHLTQTQRYYICLRIAMFDSIKTIANILKVSKSTIYREIKRNQTIAGYYDSEVAQRKTAMRRTQASKDKAFKKFTSKMKNYITEKLTDKWSPEQISGRMKFDIKKTISHESIYSYIRSDRRNGGNLYKLLPHHGKRYRYGKAKGSSIINRIDIAKRPAIVDKKQRIGDFEIDTVVSAKNTGKSCLLTMVDCRSKFVFVRKIPDKSALSAQLAIEESYQNSIIPFITITADNGTEFANHQEISANIACSFYFARPYRSCDRGLNEHSNGLIRKFLPKGTNFDTISTGQIEVIQNALNNRPRKSLNYKTPNEVINKYLQRVAINKLNSTKHQVAFHP